MLVDRAASRRGNDVERYARRTVEKALARNPAINPTWAMTWKMVPEPRRTPVCRVRPAYRA
jgi:hypothetical protein